MKKLIAASLMFVSSLSLAATQTWDFHGQTSQSTLNRAIVPNSISLTDENNTMSVTMTSWSASGSQNIYQSELWLSIWGTLVFSSRGESHFVDNSGTFEFILLSFDTDVELSGINISNYSNDSDISIAAFNSNPFEGSSAMSRWSEVSNYALASSSFSNAASTGLNQYYSLDSGVNSNKATAGVSASYWLIGAYNSAFGGSSDGRTDNVKFGGLTTKTSVPPPSNQVSAPASLSLFAAALLVMAARRKRVND